MHLEVCLQCMSEKVRSAPDGGMIQAAVSSPAPCAPMNAESLPLVAWFGCSLEIELSDLTAAAAGIGLTIGRVRCRHESVDATSTVRRTTNWLKSDVRTEQQFLAFRSCWEIRDRLSKALQQAHAEVEEAAVAVPWKAWEETAIVVRQLLPV